MFNIRFVAVGLAQALLRGKWERQELEARCADVLGRDYKFIGPLIDRLVKSTSARPTCDGLAEWFAADGGFRKAFRGRKLSLRPPSIPAAMLLAPGAPRLWSVPSIVSRDELSTWLGIDTYEMDWFADRRGLNRKNASSTLDHYRYRWVPRRSSGPPRLLEMPKFRMKQIQRKVLQRILYRIPVHDSAHGFCPGKNIVTAVRLHVAQSSVLRMDIQDFFPTVSGRQVVELFVTAGYPNEVASLLAGFCLHRTPEPILERSPDRRLGPDRSLFETRMRGVHLPQGAPSSPALANLAAFRLDCRLSGLAKSAGANYTRYADDLLFSGARWNSVTCERFQDMVKHISLDCGFRIHSGKTRWMRQGERQSALGVILNERPNIAREQYDRLKAVLHNCVVHGPESQCDHDLEEFRETLAGRIAFVVSVNTAKGHKLKAKFQQIDWNTA